MNSRVAAFSPVGKRRAWLGLTLLLPAMVTEVARTTGASLPYLPYIGPPPLRFQEARPPPELSVRPPTGDPPKAGEKSSSTSNRAPGPPPIAVAAPPAAPAVKVKSEVTSAEKSLDRPVIPEGPPPLLPDDAGAKVRPEDFLPFFQFPGANNPKPKPATVPAPPSPGVLPPSSATYQVK